MLRDCVEGELMTTKKFSIVAGAGGLLASSLAFADDPQPTVTEPGVYSYAWHEPYLRSDVGVGVTLGGGITGFTDSAMRNISSSNIGGLWDLRVAIGTHVP